jgi:Uncharacterized protein conserved in bacteria (DUF2330)
MTPVVTRRDVFGSLMGLAAGAAVLERSAERGNAACCYFAAKDKDVNQPAQKAFINWDPAEGQESFTVQPKFEGNAVDFGMVIPTPARPKLDEMPREFFKLLAVFTILEPMPLDKYKQVLARLGATGFDRFSGAKRSIQVLEEGVVGSLDYKIILAEDARGLYQWLDEHKYHYSGDEETLDFYIRKQWFFTVMKIDPKQMKHRPDGSYSGDVTPTRFTFASRELIYPLRITRLSVKESTEALFYVQAPDKMDLQDTLSYRYTWQPMWAQAMSFAIKKTADEERWEKHITPYIASYRETLQRVRGDHLEPATLEWAKRISDQDLGVIDGRVKYNRDAPAEDVQQLKLLRGHLKKDQFVTKFRKLFHVAEMRDDLVLARATAGDAPDNTEYFQILPTSPP